MRRLLIVCMAIVSIFAIGCEKEDAGLDKRLVGTKWQTRDSIYEVFYGGVCYDVYEFVSVTEVENYTTKNGNIVDMNGTFKYKLNYPYLTIYKVWSDGDTSELVFVFRDSRTIVREGENINEYAPYMKYIRQ